MFVHGLKTGVIQEAAERQRQKERGRGREKRKKKKKNCFAGTVVVTTVTTGEAKKGGKRGGIV